MHLHGCGLTIDGVLWNLQSLDDYGFLQYAAANDIIVLMPQAKYDFFVNPNECFDYYGYTNGWGDDNSYRTKDGRQPKAIKAMLDRLVEPLDDGYKYEARNIARYNWLEYFIYDTFRFWNAYPEWSVNFVVLSIFYFIPSFIYSLFGKEFNPYG